MSLKSRPNGLGQKLILMPQQKTITLNTKITIRASETETINQKRSSKTQPVR
jgi:hypothetical protein